MDTKAKIESALGKIKADIILRGGLVANVLTKEILESDVVITAGYISHVGKNSTGFEDKKTKEHLAESLGFILYAGKHMDKLITNMLVYSEDGVKDKNLYDLKSLINEVRSILKDEIEKSQAQIIFPQEDAFVYVNKILFIQVLFNLINNSIKYKDANRKPEIYIAFEHTEKETKFTHGDTITIEMGVFIPSEYRSFMVSIAFINYKKEYVAQCHSKYNKFILKNDNKKKMIKITIPHLILNPGEYTLTIIIFDSETKKYLGWYPNLYPFKVKGDFFGGTDIQLVGKWEQINIKND